MKRIIIKAVILLVTTMLCAPTMFAQKKEMHTNKIKQECLGWAGGYVGDATIPFYYDDNNRINAHGVASIKVNHKDVNYLINTTWKDGEMHGPVTASINLRKKDVSIKGNLKGEYKHNFEEGVWTSNITANNIPMSLVFGVKDRTIVSFKSSLDGEEWSISLDSKNRWSGYEKLKSGTRLNIKNSIFIDRMKDENGEWCSMSPEAKSVLDRVLNGEAKEQELVDIGLYLEKLDKNFWNECNAGLTFFDLSLNEEIYYYFLYYIRQIPRNKMIDFNECRVILEGKKSNFGEFLNTAKDMTDDYRYNNKYIKKADAEAINNYVQEETKSLFNNLMSAVENEKDFSTLLNTYSHYVQPSIQYLSQDDANKINNKYNEKKVALENACKADIMTKISLYNASKDLKQYYDGLRPTLAQIKDSSSIQSAYNNRYNELKMNEEKAAKKAERRKKIITGAKWVGGAAVVVGGYLLAKRYGLWDKE